MKSTHAAVVVPLVIHPHPDEETVNLGIVRIDDKVVVVRKADWEARKKAIYVHSQCAVDTENPLFSWLKKTEARWVEVKPVKLRGVWSDGILVPAPDNSEVGDDFTEELGVVHIDHESTNKELQESGERHCFSSVGKYDVDGAKHFLKYFTEDIEVVASLKLHGENCGVGFIDEKLRVRSRSNWLADQGHFWDTIKLYPNLIKLCEALPNHIVYGELYGKAKKGGVKFRYDLPEYQDRGFMAFDIMHPDRTFMDYDEFEKVCGQFGVKTAPVLYRGPHKPEVIFPFASHPCPLGNRVTEGIIVRPVVERKTPKFSRLQYKVVNPEYAAL